MSNIWPDYADPKYPRLPRIAIDASTDEILERMLRVIDKACPRHSRTDGVERAIEAIKANPDAKNWTLMVIASVARSTIQRAREEIDRREKSGDLPT